MGQEFLELLGYFYTTTAVVLLYFGASFCLMNL